MPKEIVQYPDMRALSEDTLHYFTPEYLAQEKYRVQSLIRWLLPSIKKEDIGIIGDFPLGLAANLFGLEDLKTRVGGTGRQEDGGYRWFISNATVATPKPQELVICQKLYPFENLMKVERSGTVTTAVGRVVARSAAIDIQEPVLGSFHAGIEVDKRLFTVRAHIDNFATKRDSSVTGKVAGTFTHDGEYVTGDIQI